VLHTIKHKQNKVKSSQIRKEHTYMHELDEKQKHTEIKGFVVESLVLGWNV
jgi:hypothetical protein